jgi:hypothetical protein
MLNIEKKNTKSGLYELKVLGLLSQYKFDCDNLEHLKSSLEVEISNIARATTAIADRYYKLRFTDESKKVLKLYHDAKKERVLALITIS